MFFKEIYYDLFVVCGRTTNFRVRVGSGSYYFGSESGPGKPLEQISGSGSGPGNVKSLKTGSGSGYGSGI